MTACVTTYDSKRPKVNPDKAVTSHINLGMAYLRDNRRDSARLHFQKAFEIQPNSAQANNGMALLLQLEGELEAAETHFQRALKADAKSSQARINYGSFLYQDERYEEAYDLFETVSKDLDYVGRSAAFVNLGRSAQRLGRLAKAEASFQNALAVDSKQSLAMLELADIYFQQHKYAESKHHLDLFAEVARQNPRSLWLSIRIERIFGNKDKEASRAMALRNLYPYSNEYLEYKKAKGQ